MDIQGKRITNPRLDKTWTLFAGTDGFMGPEEQLIFLGIAKFISVALTVVTAVILVLSYFVIGPYLVEPAIALINLVARDLTEGKFFIPFGIKVIAGKVGAVLIVLALLVRGYKAITKPEVDKAVSLHALGANSMVSPRKNMVPPNHIGVPMFIGKPREWWLYEPSTFITSPWNTFEVTSIEAISRTLDLGVKNITSKDGVRCVGRFSIVFQVYDYYTAAMVDISPNSNLYAQLIDILGAHARTAVNSLKYNKIDRGTGLDKKEQVNDAIMKVLEASYGDMEPDPRPRSDGREASKSHDVIRVGFLGVHIYGVICQELISADDELQKAREARLRVTAEVEAQKELITQLKAMPAYEGLDDRKLIDQANLILNRYNQEYFFDFGSGESGALEKLVAGMIAKFGGK